LAKIGQAKHTFKVGLSLAQPHGLGLLDPRLKLNPILGRQTAQQASSTFCIYMWTGPSPVARAGLGFGPFSFVSGPTQ
jgi:hypothetical protein